MMMYRNILLVVCLLFSVSACDENQEEVVIALPAHEEAILVECYLEPGENYRALVSKTMDFFEAEETESADSVKIHIFSDGVEKELKNMTTADTLYNKMYNYWNPEQVTFEEGKEYQISISYGDKVSATGKTKFLPKPQIKDINCKYSQEVDSLAALFVEIEDNPEEENFYRMVVRGPNPSVGHTYEGLWDDTDAADGSLTAYTNYSFWEGERVVINVYHLEEQYYHFLKSVAQARESNYNPFMQPASIQSSLEGAAGIFTAISLTSDTIKVTKQPR